MPSMAPGSETGTGSLPPVGGLAVVKINAMEQSRAEQNRAYGQGREVRRRRLSPTQMTRLARAPEEELPPLHLQVCNGAKMRALCREIEGHWDAAHEAFGTQSRRPDLVAEAAATAASRARVPVVVFGGRICAAEVRGQASGPAWVPAAASRRAGRSSPLCSAAGQLRATAVGRAMARVPRGEHR
jgi:hypothetical protein